MKIAVVLNGISLEKKFFFHDVYPALKELYTVEIFETRSRNDAFILASKAVDKQFDFILAAGGDGTIHQVMNGVLTGRETFKDLPLVGVFPVGTGNDFARGLGIEKNVEQLLSLLKNAASGKHLDIGRIVYTTADDTEDTRYFINVADIGMGPEVVKRVMKSDRPFGAAVTYYLSILATFFTYKPMEVTAKSDEWEWTGKMRTLAVANGNYYGHGLCVAPAAKADDTIFEVFLCGNASVLDFIRHTAPLKQGQYVKHPEVQYKQTRRIELTSTKPCAIEGDGEPLGWLPATVDMMPCKLRFLAP